ncbi:MAG: hypothetical protein AAB360_00900 [Patescibacteria group bacterium]
MAKRRRSRRGFSARTRVRLLIGTAAILLAVVGVMNYNTASADADPNLKAFLKTARVTLDTESSTLQAIADGKDCANPIIDFEDEEESPLFDQTLWMKAPKNSSNITINGQTGTFESTTGDGTLDQCITSEKKGVKKVYFWFKIGENVLGQPKVYRKFTIKTVFVETPDATAGEQDILKNAQIKFETSSPLDNDSTPTGYNTGKVEHGIRVTARFYKADDSALANQPVIIELPQNVRMEGKEGTTVEADTSSGETQWVFTSDKEIKNKEIKVKLKNYTRKSADLKVSFVAPDLMVEDITDQDAVKNRTAGQYLYAAKVNPAAIADITEATLEVKYDLFWRQDIIGCPACETTDGQNWQYNTDAGKKNITDDHTLNFNEGKGAYSAQQTYANVSFSFSGQVTVPSDIIKIIRNNNKIRKVYPESIVRQINEYTFKFKTSDGKTHKKTVKIDWPEVKAE